MNDGSNILGFFSKSGKKLMKGNLMLLKYEKHKVFNKSSLTPNLSKNNNIFGSNEIDSDIFSIEPPDKEKIDDIAKDILGKKIHNHNYNHHNDIIFKEKPNKSMTMRNNKKKTYFKKINYKKNDMVPPCTKYNPNYDFVLKRNASTPLWKSITGRKEKKREIFDFPFYLNHELIEDTMAGKAFIDFSKQTIRKCFDNTNNDYNNINNNSVIVDKRPISCRNNDYIDKTKSRNNSDINNSTNISDDSYELYKHLYTKELKKKEIREKMKEKRERKKNRIKSINFNKTISRKASLGIKIAKIVPYLFPNYDIGRERPIMMVSYDAQKNKSNRKTKRIEKFEDFYDVNKSCKHINSPNLGLMVSRNDDDNDSLPLYMKGIHDRNSCCKITKLSLKANNYRNGGFAVNESSFWPKKTYNKFLNFDILKSKKDFYDALFANNNTNKKKYRLLERSFYFYYKNFKEIAHKDNLDKSRKLMLKKFLENKPINDIFNNSKKEEF